MERHIQRKHLASKKNNPKTQLKTTQKANYLTIFSFSKLSKVSDCLEVEHRKPHHGSRPYFMGYIKT